MQAEQRQVALDQKASTFVRMAATPGFHVVGNTCVPNCQPASIPSAAHASRLCGRVPCRWQIVREDLRSRLSSRGNTCVKDNPICGPNAHLSKGHAVRNGKNWSNNLQKCV